MCVAREGNCDSKPWEKTSLMRFEGAQNYEDAIAKAADESGIQRDYWDIFHRRHEPSTEVRRKILESLGWKVQSFEDVEVERRRSFHRNASCIIQNTIVISAGDPFVPVSYPTGFEAAFEFEVLLEHGEALKRSTSTSNLQAIDGNEVDGQGWTTYRLPLPSEIPLGYHALTISVDGRSSGRANLIVCPDKAYLPEWLENGGRTAGFNVSLYGLRSERNWGCGDFTDVRALIDWASREIGFSFIGLNPLHALHNRVPYNTSPYLPLSIFYKNLIYIDVERAPEFSASSCAHRLLASREVQSKLRELRASQFVAYSDVDRLKKRFLKLLYREFRRLRAHNIDRANAF